MSRLLSRLRSALHVEPTLPAALLLLLLAPQAVLAAPTLGFLEKWPGTSVQGWGGTIAITYSNPGTGGVDGSGDGFLSMEQASSGHFGTRSTGPEYAGNWQAAGITQVQFWLNDIGADEPIEIHFSLGNFSNLWQYDLGFVPPSGQWASFTVDLTSAFSFTHIIAIDGQGFDAALQDVQVVHLRHDVAPFMQFPDPIAGDVGIDELLLTNSVVGVPGSSAGIGQPVELAPPYPNPSRGNVVVAATAEPGPLTIQIVDLQGRILLQTELSSRAGTRLWMWDGRDGRGRRLPSGIYRVRAFGRAGGMSRSLVRLD